MLALHLERQIFGRHFVRDRSLLAENILTETVSIDVLKTDERLKYHHVNAHCRSFHISGDICSLI